MMSAFWRVMQAAGASRGAQVVLMDLGPNLGALNRAAMIAADFIVIPVGPDLLSLQGIQILGPALRGWREGWRQRLAADPPADILLPAGRISPAGYVLLRSAIRLDRPVRQFERWIAQMPQAYAEGVCGRPFDAQADATADEDCIAKLRDYRSLAPLAQEAHKPIFFLKPADGALGAHMYAVNTARQDYEMVARKILATTGIAP